jgi:hypothetical protein
VNPVRFVTLHRDDLHPAPLALLLPFVIPKPAEHG